MDNALTRQHRDGPLQIDIVDALCAHIPSCRRIGWLEAAYSAFLTAPEVVDQEEDFRDALKSLAVIPDAFVIHQETLIFPVNGKSWSSIFPRACADLKIKDLQLYDLRHEAISRLVESRRYSIPEMMLVTGHKDPKQLMRYTQLRAKDLHR